VNRILDVPCPLVFRPSVLKSERDLKTRLFRPNAAPIVSEGRLLFDNSMPKRDWSAFDAPAKERYARTEARRKWDPNELPALLRRQAD
jgi:hypothetical protein